MTTSGDKTITIALMDPPYESGTTTTALRVVDAACARASTSTSSPTRAP